MSKKAKVSKRVAGIKVPKTLRKHAKPLVQLLASPDVAAIRIKYVDQARVVVAMAERIAKASV